MLQLLRGETIKSIAVSPPARVEHRGCKWVEVILIDPTIDPITIDPIVGIPSSNAATAFDHRIERSLSTIQTR
jgi:hypothetical protein